MEQQHKIIPPERDHRIFAEVRDFLQTLNSDGGKPIEALTPPEARQVLADAQKSITFRYDAVTEFEITVPYDGEKVNVHIVKPASAPEKRMPAFLFIHGGGWVLGDYPTHRRLVRDLVLSSGAVAVFPDYTPSPEAQFPQALHQIYAVLEWLSGHGEEIGIDSDRIAIAGNSVGGNMTAAIAIMAKDKGGPNLRFQLMLWPVTDADFTTASYEDLGEGRFLTTNMMRWFWDNYMPDQTKRKNKYASPLQASVSELAGLPPALIQTAENDVLRDEGEAYARKLNEAGVPVTLTRYGGLIHDYGLLNALAEVPAVQSALWQAGAILGKALAQR